MTQPPAPSLSPDDLAVLEQAAQLRQEGQAERAAEIYRQWLQHCEEPPLELLFNCANAVFDAGGYAEALERFEAILARNPLLEAAAIQAARCAVKLAATARAEALFRQVLAQNASQFTALLELGNLLRHQGELAAAEAHYRLAIQAEPQRYEAHLALARLLEERGELDGGGAHYHLAVLACAGQAEALSRLHWQMACFRLERGAATSALDALRQALLVGRLADPALDPNLRCEQQITLGEILMRLGLVELAHRAFERASTATAEDTLVRLADLSFRFNLWQEAQDVLRRNLELHPESAMARWNLAHVCVESWQLGEAEELLRQAEAIQPIAGATSMRASMAARLGQADRALELYCGLARQEGPGSAMASSAAMASLYCDHLSADQVADLHRQLFASLGQGARPAEAFRNGREPERRLRLGLVSADFHHQHPVNLFLQPVLARLNRRDWHVSVYFTGGSVDEQTRLARQRVDRWRQVGHLSQQQLAGWIEADGIDILVDLAGHTSDQRVGLFAQRAAPVQVTYLGYPGSTGVPNIDWILADPIVAPPEDDCQFSERVARLPHMVFCFHPEVEYPLPVFDDSFLERPLTFGSFNNVVKITRVTVRLWSLVLQAVPESRLLLKAPSFKDEGAIRHFEERFAAEGIGAERLEFRGPVGLDQMMAEYADVDIALDPFPYNGGTTSHQALWMGVPLISRRGHNFVSRMGASLLTAAGLEDWIADSDQEVVAIAVEQSRDRRALLELKRGLRARLCQRPGWDIEAHVGAMEQVLRQMWRDWVDSQAQSTVA